MDDDGGGEPIQRTLSLVPYVPDQSREIVLRHNSTVVVYDEDSKQLSLRDASRSSVELTRCPTCNRPYHNAPPPASRRDPSPPSPDEESPHGHAHYMDPSYFRLLSQATAEDRAASPRRRLGETERTATPVENNHRQPQAHGISATAFSQGYFNRFFVEEKELGKGGKGVVLLVKHVLDGVSLGHFACKRVTVGDNHEWLEKVLQEVQLLQTLAHQNLVSYRHVWLENYQANSFVPSVPCAFILQQFCNAGDLAQYVLEPAKMTVTTEELKERIRRRSKNQPEPPVDLHAPRRMQFEEVFSFFKDITSGLHHLHAHGYIHRDLKPSNCLLHAENHKIRVLVSDFGEVQLAGNARRSTGATGTISYCAPEVLRRETPSGSYGNFTTKSDVFSLGMIVYFMCFAKLPYSNADAINEEREDIDTLRTEIAAWAGFDDGRHAREDLPDRLYKFLKRLLAIDPAARPSTEDILNGIRAGSALEDLDDEVPHPNILDSLRSRIQSVDSSPRSPSPAVARKRPARARQNFYPTTSRSPDAERHSSPLSSSPPKATPAPVAAVVPVRKRTDSGARSPRSIPAPLALPPPEGVLQLYQIVRNPMFAAMLRISFLLIKYVTLTGPCHPFGTRGVAAYPLLVLAGLDFVGRWEAGRSLGLLAIHLILVGLIGRGGWLCEGGGPAW